MDVSPSSIQLVSDLCGWPHKASMSSENLVKTENLIYQSTNKSSNVEQTWRRVASSLSGIECPPTIFSSQETYSRKGPVSSSNRCVSKSRLKAGQVGTNIKDIAYMRNGRTLIKECDLSIKKTP